MVTGGVEGEDLDAGAGRDVGEAADHAGAARDEHGEGEVGGAGEDHESWF